MVDAGKLSGDFFSFIIFAITDKRTDVWSRPSCIYTQTFSPKKLFWGQKIFFDFFLQKRYYATFQCGCYSVFMEI